VALVRTDVSEDGIASIIRATIIGDTFLRNVGSYKSHMASLPRRRHLSYFTTVQRRRRKYMPFAAKGNVMIFLWPPCVPTSNFAVPKC
jgi:hypothetical protein